MTLSDTIMTTGSKAKVQKIEYGKRFSVFNAHLQFYSIVVNVVGQTLNSLTLGVNTHIKELYKICWDTNGSL